MKQIVRFVLRFLPVVLLLAVMSLMADDEPEQDPSVVPTGSGADSVYLLINARYQSVKPIFANGCFDCHSANTDFPWYHSLPIIGGVIDDHIKEGREHLDLSNDFPFAGKEGQAALLHEIRREIDEKDMPLLSYRLMHWDALIEGDRRDSVFAWIDEALVMLDSLKQK